jgi:hypothetical protein
MSTHRTTKESRSKKWLVGLVVIAGLLVSSTAMAQDKPKTKFYDFDDMLVEGEFKEPDIMKERARDRANFQRLSNLKKSFLPKVRKTTEERALK